jgi:hypothetical protein
MFPLEYDRMTFDHLETRLYMVKSNNVYEMKMDELEKFWTKKNYAAEILLERSNVSLKDFYNKVLTLHPTANKTISDVVIFDKRIFYLQTDGELWQQSFDETYPTKIAHTNLTSINFIPFLNVPKLYNYFKNSEPPYKLSSSLISYVNDFGYASNKVHASNPFVVTLPERPKMETNGLNNFWIYCLYLMDIAFIITFFYVLRKLFNGKKHSFELVNISDFTSKYVENTDLLDRERKSPYP